MDHVRFGEDGTAAGDAGDTRSPFRQRREFLLDGDPQARGLLVQKRARARGAFGIDIEILDGHPVSGRTGIKENVSRVMATDVDHGAAFRDEIAGRLLPGPGSR
jgi:hypothetical protein